MTIVNKNIVNHLLLEPKKMSWKTDVRLLSHRFHENLRPADFTLNNVAPVTRKVLRMPFRGKRAHNNIKLYNVDFLIVVGFNFP